MKEQNNITWGTGIKLGLAGAYRVQVVDGTTKEVVSDYGWHKNLILNDGMDAVASVAIADLMHYGVAGTGSRPNSLTASTSQITQSGYYISLQTIGDWQTFTQSVVTRADGMYYYTQSGVVVTDATMSYTSSVSLGDVIIDENFSQSIVVGVSGSILAVNNSYNYITPISFSIWKTSQSRLQGEISRSGTYYQGSSSLVGWNCGTEWSSSLTNYTTSIAVHRRTWDFTVENQSRSYTEVGTSWDNTRFNPCFSRVLLPQTVSISPNQQLRLTYDLMAIFGPYSPQYSTASITGWPVAPSMTTIGTQSLQSFITSYVNVNGNSKGMGAYGNVYPLDPSGPCSDIGCYASNNCCVWVSEDSWSLNTSSVVLTPGTSLVAGRTLPAAPGAETDWAAGTMASYTKGSYTQLKYGTLSIYQGVSNNIRSMGFGCTGNVNCYLLTPTPNSSGQCMVFVFDQPQVKTNRQTLTLQWKWTWSRVIE